MQRAAYVELANTATMIAAIAVSAALQRRRMRALRDDMRQQFDRLSAFLAEMNRVQAKQG